MQKKGEKEREEKERKRENAAYLGPFVTETRREPAARSMAAISAGSRKPGWSDSTSCRVPGETEQVTRLFLWKCRLMECRLSSLCRAACKCIRLPRLDSRESSTLQRSDRELCRTLIKNIISGTYKTRYIDDYRVQKTRRYKLVACVGTY